MQFSQSCYSTALLQWIWVSLGCPKRSKNGLQLMSRTGFHFVTFFVLNLVPFWVPFGHPKFVPKSPAGQCWRIWPLLRSILAAQEAPSRNLGCWGVHLELSGRAVALHFGLPRSHFHPPWLRFEALLGSLGALLVTFASPHILSQRCSEAHADKTMYDMIKSRPGGVRDRVIDIIYICIHIYYI